MLNAAEHEIFSASKYENAIFNLQAKVCFKYSKYVNLYKTCITRLFMFVFVFCLFYMWPKKVTNEWTGIFIESGPEVMKLFSCSTQLSMKFVMLINLKLLTIANSFLLNIAEHETFFAYKYENTNFVGIFIFISRENFILSWVEHEKSFITSWQDKGFSAWSCIRNCW